MDHTGGHVLPSLLAALPVVAACAHHDGGGGHGGHGGHGAGDGHDGHRFDDVERWRERFEGEDRAEWQKPDELVAALGLKPGDAVADLGAGTGYFSRRLAAAVAPDGVVYATDIEPNMVAHLRDDSAKRGLTNLVPVLARPDDPTLPVGELDLVFICNTIHHFPDIPRYLAAVLASVKVGGRMVVVDWAKRETPMGPPLEIRMSREEIVAAAEGAGWKPVELSFILPYQSVVVFQRP